MLVYWSWRSLNISMEYPSLDTAKAGAIRFNTDSIQMEIYDGNQWTGILATSPELQTGGTRGLFAGGYTVPSVTNEIDFINVDTTGNALDFGNLQNNIRGKAGLASRTRGLFAGGRTPTDINTIDFVTIASTGNASDFGDLTITSHHGTGLSDSTRGIITAMENPGWTSSNSNRIDFVTIASTGNANDFGDLYFGTRECGGCASPTRGVVFSGTPSGSNVIQFFTISTQGNSADFGDLTTVGQRGKGGSNAVRGLFSIGLTPSVTNAVDFVTIATLGNAQDFGDLIEARGNACATASTTRFVVAGGGAPSVVDTIDFAQIMTTGNFVSFGELVGADRSQLGALSNGHGGL